MVLGGLEKSIAVRVTGCMSIRLELVDKGAKGLEFWVYGVGFVGCR